MRIIYNFKIYIALYGYESLKNKSELVKNNYGVEGIKGNLFDKQYEFQSVIKCL